jgi:prepilin-type N-terminal cleavage/methylation domain-containing protein
MRASWTSKQAGFTIVELLIVIVVIAILAVISVVAYTNIQNRANDAAVQSDLRALSRKFELYKVDNSANAYPYGAVLGTGTNTGMSMTFSQGSYQTGNVYNVLNCITSGGANYAVLAQSKSGKYFTVGSLDGSVKEVTAPVTLANLTSCSTILPSSSASGAAYDSGSGWRNWAKGN